MSRDAAPLSAGVIYGLVTATIWAGFPALTQFSLSQTLTPYDITALRSSASTRPPCQLLGVALVTVGMLFALGLTRRRVWAPGTAAPR